MESKQAIRYLCFLFDSYYVNVMLLIPSKAAITYTGSFILLIKIKFAHVQISVPKIGMSILKTACINPWEGHAL